MEQEWNAIPPEEEERGYVPRPTWQVWAARVGLIIFVICVILYYLHIAGGGR